MSILEKRLRLHRRQYEERRRYIAELASLAEGLRADGRRLQADIERAVAVGKSVAAGPLIERLGKVETSLAAIEAQIAAVGEGLAAAAQELKGHELAWGRVVAQSGRPVSRRTLPPASSKAGRRRRG